MKNAQTVHCHPSSSLFEKQPTWIIYHELVLTSKEFMRNMIEIDAKWLIEIAPHYYKKTDVFEDEKKKKTLKVAPVKKS